MNLVQLKTFLVVSRTMSFTAAAEELLLSQPAVSKQITTLEEEIGAKLFVREHNVLYLTSAGKMLAEELPSKLSELENTFFSAHLIDIGKIKKIKLGMLHNQRFHPLLLKIVREMREENYYVTLQLYDFIGLEQALERQEIDVAVSIKWSENAFLNTHEYEICKEKICLAINTEYNSQIPPDFTRTGLEKYSAKIPTIIPRLSSYPIKTQSTIAGMNTMLWSGVKEEHVDMIIPMVQTGIGSALINEMHTLSSDKNIKLFPIDHLPPVPFKVFVARDNKNTSVDDFIRKLGF